MNTNNTEDQNDQDLPGYPHYPAKDDITRAGNSNGKLELDESNINTPDTNAEGRLPKAVSTLEGNDDAYSANTINSTNKNNSDTKSDEADIVMGTEADVTAEDLQMLEAADQNMDTVDDINLTRGALDDVDEDGDLLSETDEPGDLDGNNLDVPGAELDDADEATGEEDEENNYYSLGGDNHEAQEENNGDQ